MKINETSNNSFQNKVLIDTFIEQISALQTDVGDLQIADDNLAQALAAKANTADISNEVSTDTLNTTNGNIKTLKVQGPGAEATLENATIGEATIATENVIQSNITNLEVMDVDAGTVRAGTIVVENDATVSGNLAVQDIGAKDITSASVNTLNLTAAEADINKLEAQNAKVTGKLEVNDLEVSGNFTGVSSIESESIKSENITSDNADIETLNVKNIRDWVSQIMNQEQMLTPSPQLGNADRYTIELPSFNGVFLLSWEDSDVLWSATVIGNGKSYGISWGSRTEENYITDIFQYNGKLYIRISCNGKLKYAYSATKELSPITIYFNMDGWTEEKSLEKLCDEESHIENAYPTGTAWLGPVFIPRLVEGEGSGSGINFKGSCKFAEIPSFADVKVGDVWNITDEAYTNRHFVEGAGKPINAGDDVIAVDMELDYEGFEIYNLPKLEEGHKFALVHKFGDVVLAFEIFAEPAQGGTYKSLTRVWRKEDDEFVVVSENTNPPGCDPSLGTSQPRELWPAEGFYTDNPSYYNGRIFIFGSGTFPCIYSDDYGETWHHDSGGTTWGNSGGSGYSTQLANGTIIGKGNGGYLYISDDNGETFSIHFIPHPDWDQDGDIVVNGDLFEEYGELGWIYPIGSIKNPNSPYYGAAVAIPLSTSYAPGRLIYSYDGIKWDIFKYNNSYTYFDMDQNKYFLDELPNGDLLLKKVVDAADASNTHLNGRGCTNDTVQKIIKLEDIYPEEELEEFKYTDLIDIQGEGLNFCWTAVKNDKIYSSVGSVSKDNGRTWHYVEDARIHIPSGENPDYYDTPYPQALPYIDGNDVVFLYTFSGRPEAYSKSIRKQLAWDKFSAGVNYDNFVAKNITATESLKSEGTLEVDDTSQFDDDVTVNADLNADKVITPDLEVTNAMTANNTGVNITRNVTHTGNYTATGNLTRTGNETISGLVIIGELD